MPTGEYTLRSEPPHSSQVVSGSSVNFWTTSSRSSHAVHAYWYVGTGPSLHDAGTHRHRLPNVNAEGPLTNPSGPYLSGSLVIPAEGRATSRTRWSWSSAGTSSSSSPSYTSTMMGIT